MLEEEHKPKIKAIGAKPNVILFACMLYYFVLGRSLVQPYILTPIYHFLGVYPLSTWGGVVNVFFRDFGIPVLLYLLYGWKTKQKLRSSFSLSRLSVTNILYISVMTLAIRLVFNLLENAVLFFFLGGVSIGQFRFMGIGQSLLHNAILASVFEELVFRGFLWGEYRKSQVSYWKTALISGLFFGVIHLGQFSMLHTAFSGVFFYAPLIYFTRSIWAPILHHTLMNGLYTLLNPSFYLESQAVLDGFMPTYLILLFLATLIVLPAAVVCAKKFWLENRHRVEEKAPLTQETPLFRLSYWALIVVILATFLRG